MTHYLKQKFRLVPVTSHDGQVSVRQFEENIRTPGAAPKSDQLIGQHSRASSELFTILVGR